MRCRSNCDDWVIEAYLTRERGVNQSRTSLTFWSMSVTLWSTEDRQLFDLLRIEALLMLIEIFEPWLEKCSMDDKWG